MLSVSGGVKITSQGLTWQEEGSVRKYFVIYRKAGARHHPPLALETCLMPRVLGALWGLRNQAAYEWKRQDRRPQKAPCMDMSLERSRPLPGYLGGLEHG